MEQMTIKRKHAIRALVERSARSNLTAVTTKGERQMPVLSTAKPKLQVANDAVTRSLMSEISSRKMTASSTQHVSTSMTMAVSYSVPKGSIASDDISPRQAVYTVPPVASTSASTSTSFSNSTGPGFSKKSIYATAVICSVVTMAIFLFLGVFLYKRWKDKRRNEDWLGISPEGGSRASTVPGRGPMARGERLPDEDVIAFNNHEKSVVYSSDVSPPADEKKAFSFSSSFPPARPNHTMLSDPYLAKNTDLSNTAVPLTPSHPGYVPTRPPRPSEQYHFSSAPINAIKRQGSPHNSKPIDPTNLSSYERNLLALTSSMSFDSTSVRSASLKYQMQPVDLLYANQTGNTRKRSLSTHRNQKKDTIVGFAETYSDMGDRTEEPVPIYPLSIRNPDPLTDFPQDKQGKQSGPYPLQRSASSPFMALSRTPDLPPTLDLGVPSQFMSASMQDLENVLGSFGQADATLPQPIERSNGTHADSQTALTSSKLGNRAPNRSLLGQNAVRDQEIIADDISSRSSYKTSRPNTGTVGSALLVNNTISIHSTAGEVGQMSPVEASFPTSSQASGYAINAASSASSANSLVIPSQANLPMSSIKPLLADKQRSSSLSSARSEKVGEYVRTSGPTKGFSMDEDLIADSPNAGIAVTPSMSYDTGPMTAAMSTFVLQDNTSLTRAISLGRNDRSYQVSRENPIMQRPRSVSVSKLQTRTSQRSRTSTAYGGQMPMIPISSKREHDRRSRTMTTESEAVFSLGSHMLAAFPDTPPTMPFLRSPDLRIQPPSPSQSSQITDFSMFDKKGTFYEQMTDGGFAPLAQMALSAGGHDRHYRSPTDSIVGVFEYDDPRHSALLSLNKPGFN